MDDERNLDTYFCMWKNFPLIIFNYKKEVKIETKQFNKAKANVPNAELKNGELYDVSQFVKTIKESRFF